MLPYISSILSTQLNTDSPTYFSRRVTAPTTGVMGDELWKASSSYPIAYSIVRRAFKNLQTILHNEVKYVSCTLTWQNSPPHYRSSLHIIDYPLTLSAILTIYCIESLLLALTFVKENIFLSVPHSSVIQESASHHSNLNLQSASKHNHIRPMA